MELIGYNITTYPRNVTAVALSPDDTLVAVGTSENQLQLYERSTHQKLLDMTGISSPIRQFHFHPNGKMLLSKKLSLLVSLLERLLKNISLRRMVIMK